MKDEDELSEKEIQTIMKVRDRIIKGISNEFDKTLSLGPAGHLLVIVEVVGVMMAFFENHSETGDLCELFDMMKENYLEKRKIISKVKNRKLN